MGLLRLGLTISLCLSCAQCDWIIAPNVTTWGDWGPVDRCPPGTFVNGIQVKAQSYKGADLDNTALNGVRLSCINVKYPDNKSQFPYPIQGTINSSVMTFGNWRPWSYCVEGIAVGFELRSEENQGGGDDSAANDMRLICANHKGLHTTEEYGEKSGNWTGIQRCRVYKAVCGIQTQVDFNQGSGDDTALNNVGLLCCKLPNPAKLCKPSVEWVPIWSRNFPAVGSPACVSISVKYGVSHNYEPSQSGNVVDHVSSAVRFGKVDEISAWLWTTFETPLSNSVTAKYHWSRTRSASWRTETEESMGFLIPRNCNTTLFQVVGKCGWYTVKVIQLKRVDECASGSEESDVGWRSTVCPVKKGRASVGVVNILFLGFCLTTQFDLLGFLLFD